MGKEQTYPLPGAQNAVHAEAAARRGQDQVAAEALKPGSTPAEMSAARPKNLNCVIISATHPFSRLPDLNNSLLFLRQLWRSGGREFDQGFGG